MIKKVIAATAAALLFTATFCGASAIILSQYNIPAAEWSQLQKAAGTVPRNVVWCLTITDVSREGGYQVKGHIRDSAAERVRLTWSQRPSAVEKTMLSKGAVVVVSAELLETTQDGEIVLRVNHVRI